MDQGFRRDGHPFLFLSPFHLPETGTGRLQEQFQRPGVGFSNGTEQGHC
jgi:hypothetical protein